MGANCKILLICDEDDTNVELIRQSVQAYSNVQHITPAEVKIEIDRIAPDLVLLAEPKDGTGIELVEYIHSEYRSAIIIYLSDEQDFLQLRDATRAGATDFFVLP